ncbi:HAD-IG family 5'-nucleotidase [Haliangium ochraceum]|uniref:HAD superfamily (Subfamily IG) hydrolase, 5'-nucleotidase n=1 Tax=Haliangium ochraceum (strain DSM 14365 / JCM 11303 / SMP-2) TaxID=502025 RepID=D0LV97_HALO1|nr:HAD-IG family 5'-nucleotidase [Haliangium ochraceum]ACY15938.1 HAD superfamily (subfamily IG) hydrolase, 5'- nucleotidase [Haliangium ochraceum DSM 14365]
MSGESSDARARLTALLADIRSESGAVTRGRVYCNRSIKLSSIDYIGFDMDYTLARYQQERLEKLSIDLTLKYLVQNHGYPDAIRELRYDPRFAIRGLVVDRALGNVLKMDRHGYVRRAYHGFRLLDKEERREHYLSKRINLSDKHYVWIDTLFSLPEAVMFVTLVDYFDNRQDEVDYAALYDDIRASIDLAHRDDSLKSIIKADLAAYIVADPALSETLHKLRSSGKKLFLLTNSYYDYTRAVMSYLLDGISAAYPSWREYFDIVIVGGEKPGFFTGQKPFVPIDPDSGEVIPGEVAELAPGRIYQGGNILDFERMSGAMGAQVLYIGDHIYGDILRLKKSHVWRTAMVLQELEDEYSVGARAEQRIRDLTVLDRRRRNIESEIDFQMLVLKQLQNLLEEVGAEADEALRHEAAEAVRQAEESLASLQLRARLMQEEVDALEDSIDHMYNPYWGSSFRAGHESSRFGEQVSDYADLYTSRVSNFLAYSPLRYFRAPRRLMPHDL